MGADGLTPRLSDMSCRQGLRVGDVGPLSKEERENIKT